MTSGVDPETAAEEPLGPETVIAPSPAWALPSLLEVWTARGVLYFLVWRDLKVRYRQTILGVAWVVLQPLTTVVALTLVFGRLLRVPTDGVPYVLFAFAGLLPWNLFSGTVTRAAASLVGNAQLVGKVYFPRLILPTASGLILLVDFAVAFLPWPVLLLAYGVSPGAGLLLLPLFVAWALLAALAVGLWLAALNARYRDVTHLLPLALQVWMYATPVIYSSSLIPARWRPLLALNPMVAVVDGFRWAALGLGPERAPSLEAVGLSLAVTAATLLGGLVFFRAAERTLADVV